SCFVRRGKPSPQPAWLLQASTSLFDPHPEERARGARLEGEATDRASLRRALNRTRSEQTPPPGLAEITLISNLAFASLRVRKSSFYGSRPRVMYPFLTVSPELSKSRNRENLSSGDSLNRSRAS